MTAVRYCVFEPKTPVMPEYQLPDSSCFGGVAAACWFGCWVVAVHCGRAGAACPGTGSGAFGAGIASLGRSGISGELEVAFGAQHRRLRAAKSHIAHASAAGSQRAKRYGSRQP